MLNKYCISTNTVGTVGEANQSRGYTATFNPANKYIAPKDRKKSPYAYTEDWKVIDRICEENNLLPKCFEETSILENSKLFNYMNEMCSGEKWL
jgi:hypothetical protein